MNHNKRGRPVEDEKQKIDRELLKEKFLENSLDALETIINIMKYSMDSAVRLKASMFIINKVVPEGFMCEDETNRKITVNIVTRSADDVLAYEDQEEIMQEAERDDADDDWDNTDIYIPKK